MNIQASEKELKRRISLFLIALSLTFLTTLVVAVPTGPTSIVFENNSTASTTAGLLVNISGGVISKINITATTQNDNWKAFVGDITGAFTLDDASGSTIYDWTLGSVTGEIYTTRSSGTIDWSNIICATLANVTTEENEMFHTGEDNISVTFNHSNSATFVVAGNTITAASCGYSTNTFTNDAYQLVEFEETILSDHTNIVYAAILEENVVGYDGGAYDFQMLVPENASETFTGATAYYLYVELS